MRGNKIFLKSHLKSILCGVVNKLMELGISFIYFFIKFQKKEVLVF